MSTALESSPTQDAATGLLGDDLHHLFCCDINRAMCGHDLTNSTLVDGPMPDELICAVCADLDLIACAICERHSP